MSIPATLTGRLTADPEITIAKSGTTIARFTVVTSRRVKDGDQWKDEGTSFWNCTAFGQLAQNVADSLTKGTAVIVTGRAEQENWEGRDGQKRSGIKVIADEVAPSLKWATAKITKSGDGQSGGNRGQQSQGGGNRGNAGAQRQSGQATRSSGPQQDDPWASGGGGGWGGSADAGSPPF